jgi:hypothetical protein
MRETFITELGVLFIGIHTLRISYFNYYTLYILLIGIHMLFDSV